MKRKQPSLASFLPSQTGTHSNTSIDTNKSNNDFGYGNGTTTTTTSSGVGDTYSSRDRYDDEWKENSFVSSSSSSSAAGIHQADDQHIPTSIPTISKRRVLPPSINKTIPPPAMKTLPSFRPLNSTSDPHYSSATVTPNVKKAQGGTFFKKTLAAADGGALSLPPPYGSSSGGKRSSDVPTYMDEVTLSSSQKKVLDAVMKRRSVFFTGAAGTGKSYVLKVLSDALEVVKMTHKVSFTAPTGVAACNIRGLTIHSWAGVGMGSEPIAELSARVSRSSQACQRWKETDILVIDEISMLSGDLFDKLSFIGRRIRGDPRPFGGIQLILSGDFFQLPPVGLGKNSVKFCFESEAWHEIFSGRDDGMILLDKVFRQQNDSEFLHILNDLRKGEVSRRASQVLSGKVQQASTSTAISLAGSSAPKISDGPVIIPTKLFSRNVDVDGYNSEQLKKLALAQGEDAPCELYIADDYGDEYSMNQLRQGTKAPKELSLRVGAQVMLLKNLSTSRGLVNGARGTVVGFQKHDDTKYQLLPLCTFQVFLGSQMAEETIVIERDTWDIRQGERILAERKQVPLILAWAISVHKSQGMTIPFLEVSFNGVFEYGQGYVALSRATCLEGLTLTSFHENSIKAHPKVCDFYNRIAATPTAPVSQCTINSSISSIASSSSSSSHEGSTVVQQSADIVTQIGVFARQFIRELPPLHMDNDGWIDAKESSVKLIRSAIASYEVDTSAPTTTSSTTAASTTNATTTKSNSSKLNKYVDPASHSSMSSQSSSSTTLSSGKMFSMFSFVGPQQATNARITDSQQTSNRHKGSSGSESGYGSVHNQSSSSSSSSSNRNNADYRSQGEQSSSSIDHHHQHPLSAKSPEGGNVPVKAPTSGELSDHIKKRIEQNRLAALERLKNSRLKAEYEATSVLSCYDR